MLLWIVDLALVSCGVILPLVLEIYYVYVYCVPLFDSHVPGVLPTERASSKALARSSSLARATPACVLLLYVVVPTSHLLGSRTRYRYTDTS